MREVVIRLAAIGIFLLILCSSAACGETSLASPASILEAWNARDGQELRTHILSYWNENLDGNRLSWPLNIRLGGTTEELISRPESWDLAIVSSQEVDLRALADAGLLEAYPNVPFMTANLHQWMLPDELKALLPDDPLLVYEVYVYDYDCMAGEATLLICQANTGKKKNHPRNPDSFAVALLGRRSADIVRAVEGISRIEATFSSRKIEPGNLLEWPIDELVKRPQDWDVANILIQSESDLAALDEAGLLRDLSQDASWLDRSYDWPVPNGVYAGEGRLIAIPYIPYTGPAKDGFWVTAVNTRCMDFSKAMAYLTHWIKSNEWAYSFYAQRKTLERDVPAEIQKYGICIYKDEMDW